MFLDPRETPCRQNPERLVAAVKYLRQLKDDEGEVKYPSYQLGRGNFGYVEAFIKREIQYIRNEDAARRREKERLIYRRWKDESRHSFGWKSWLCGIF